MQRIGVVVEPSDIPGDCMAVFNPAVHLENGEVITLCRLVNRQNESELRRIVFDKNLRIKHVDPNPTIVGQGEEEKLGCEDPRISEISTNEPHVITYTAVWGYMNISGWRTKIGLITSEDLKNFNRLGYVNLPGQEGISNKNGVILPGKVNGYFCLYHRIHPNVWITFSEDLVNWQDIRPVMFIRPGWWDSDRIGIGTILFTDDGWLAFYHGADQIDVYRMGAALFDLEKPYKLLARSKNPLLEPEKRYEKEGLVPNVVFPCGAFSSNGTYIVLYGAADKVTAAAEFTKKEVMNNLKPV